MTINLFLLLLNFDIYVQEISDISMNIKFTIKRLEFNLRVIN